MAMMAQLFDQLVPRKYITKKSCWLKLDEQMCEVELRISSVNLCLVFSRLTARVTRCRAGVDCAHDSDKCPSQETCPNTRRIQPPWLWCSSRDQVHALRVIRLDMQNFYESISLPLSSDPSRLSGKDLIALSTKEQPIETHGDGESA